MTERKLPPLPWSYQTMTPAGSAEGRGHVYIVDANGRKIASVWGRGEEKLAFAELVCDASDREAAIKK